MGLIPAPSPLTDLVYYNEIYFHSIVLALTRPGSILVWGGDGSDVVDRVKAAVNHNPGNKSLNYKEVSNYQYYDAVESQALISYLDPIGRVQVVVSNNTDGQDTQPLIDPASWFYAKRPLGIGYSELFIGDWITHVRRYDYQHNYLGLKLVHMALAIAVRPSGDVYFWHEDLPLPFNASTEYSIEADNPIPAVGLHYNFDLAQLEADGTLRYDYDPALDGSIYKMTSTATVIINPGKALTGKLAMEQAVRMTCMPKISDIGLRAEAEANLSVHSYVPKFAACHFYARALLDADNGLKFRLYGGAYAVKATATMGNLTTEFKGTASLRVSGVRQHCLDRNWDLIGQINAELKVSTHC